MTTAPTKRSQHAARKPVITETKLRRIIRDELARQVLIQEGFLDFVKKPFAKLSEKAKIWVSEKVAQVLAKLKDVMTSLGDKKPEGLDTFWNYFESAEGGMSREELTSQAGLTNLTNDLSKEKLSSELDISAVATSGDNVTKESISFEKLKLDCLLIEEEYEQNKLNRLSSLNENLLTEAIVTTLLAGWWTVTKTVIGTCGIVITALKISAKIFKYFKKDNIAKKLNHYAHVIHTLEEKFAKTFVYPPPVAYAAYLAASALKAGVAIAQVEDSPNVLSYTEFNAPENKKEKEAAQKLIHIALLSAIVIEAITHLSHIVHELLSHIAEATHAAAEVGIEGTGIASKIGGALEAGADVGTSTLSRAAGVAGRASLRAAAQV